MKKHTLLSTLKCLLSGGFIAFQHFLLQGQPASDTAQASVIESIQYQLKTGKKTLNEILSDSAYLPLHPVTAFRQTIQQQAKAEKITLNTVQEPGTKIRVIGTIRYQDKPLDNALVYVYQTDYRGWYSDTAAHVSGNEGDRKHARLFGYFKTDATGSFEIATVKPKGYPHSSLPAHIHIEIAAPGYPRITELLFDDDERLNDINRNNARREKFILASNSGTKEQPVYDYLIRLE